MSNNIIPLQPVVIRDKRLKLSESREYAVFEGGKQITYQPSVSTNFSNSQISFSVTTPSTNIVVDRKLYIKYQVTLVFTPVANPSGIKILQQGIDAFRAFPLTSCTNSISVQINGVSVSLNPEDLIHALLRYNTSDHVIDIDYSNCPAMLDKSQNYLSLNNSVRNPLAFYGDDSFHQTRGSFVLDSVTNSDTSATVIATITEPLFISPLNFGAGNSQGLIGVQNLDITLTLSNLSRMWSHMSGANGVVFNTNSINVTLESPVLLLNYITPKEIFPIPAIVPYSYYKVDDYQTNQGISLAPGGAATLISSNTQLSQVPRRMFIFITRPKSGVGEKTLNTTDTFFSIENVSINWNNVNSVLSSATKQDLYNISVKNGCNLSWNEWSGQETFRLGTNPIGNADESFPLTGSVLCLDFGEDIGLDSTLAPGVPGNFNLQVQVSTINVNPTDTINPILHVVVIYEGAFSIYNRTATPSLSVLSKTDVLNVSQYPELSLTPLDMFYGGGFWSKFKDIVSDVARGIERGIDVGKKVAPYVAKLAPYALPLLGLGEEGGGIVGGSVIGGCDDRQANPYMGGKMLPKKKLRRRLKM